MFSALLLAKPDLFPNIRLEAAELSIFKDLPIVFVVIILGSKDIEAPSLALPPPEAPHFREASP